MAYKHTLWQRTKTKPPRPKSYGFSGLTWNGGKPVKRPSRPSMDNQRAKLPTIKRPTMPITATMRPGQLPREWRP